MDVLCPSCRRVHRGITPDSAVVCACGRVVRARRPGDVAREQNFRSERHALRTVNAAQQQNRRIGTFVGVVVVLGILATVAISLLR